MNDEKYVQAHIPRLLYRKLGVYAAEHDLSIKKVVLEAIKKFLGEPA